MDFTPTGTDFALLFVFLFLFRWLWLVHCEPGSPKHGTHSPNDPASASFSFLEWILCGLLGAFTVTSVILLFTAQLGIFRIRFWLLLLAVFDLAAVSVCFARWRERAPAHDLPAADSNGRDLWLLPLVVFAFWMMNRPAEFVSTYRDPGEYVNIAVKLADSPSLRIQDPQFQHFNTPEKQALFLREPLEQAPFPEVSAGLLPRRPSKGRTAAAVLPPLPALASTLFQAVAV